jgi:hypothetical protein
MSEVVIMAEITEKVGFLIDQGIIPDFAHYPEYSERDQIQLIDNVSPETLIIIPFNETLIEHSLLTGKEKILVVTDNPRERYRARQMGSNLKACASHGIEYACQLL